MSADETDTDKIGEEVKRIEATRWLTDAAGRTVFYPDGSARNGYVVTDAAREQALRAASQRHDAIRRRSIGPFGVAAAAVAAATLSFLLGSHPILSWVAFLAVFVASFVLFGLIQRLIQRVVFGSLLAGLEAAPAADKFPHVSFRGASLVLALLCAAIWFVLYLYDRRVADVAAGSTTVDFYPDISFYVLVTVLLAPLIWLFIRGWSRSEAKFGANRVLLCAMLMVVADVGGAIAVAWNLYDPQPKVVLSRDFLSCGGDHLRWIEITDLSLQEGRRGSEYVRIERQAATGSSERCTVTGLNANYGTVYQAIWNGWQAARVAPTARDGGFDQLPPGSVREKVFAVLGSPTVSGPSADGGQFSLFLPDGANSRGSGTRRITVAYFDAQQRLQRLAVYTLRDGRVVDDLSHATLARGPELGLLRMMLLR
ncbi:MAG TPA: hypothetical protein VK438_13645 [Xanthobacteraceae bacterium]|nr:hypothetical protein [Xanthobacteraceae bacterium]